MSYRWIREHLNDKLLELEKIHIDYNSFDMLVKIVTRDKLETCCSIVGMVSSPISSGMKGFVGFFLPFSEGWDH